MLRKLFGGLALLALGLSPLSAKTKHVQLRDYGLRSGSTDNAAPYLQKLLESERRQLGKRDTLVIHFDEGIYRFAEQGAPRKEVYISNHDQMQTPRAIGILLEGLSHVRLEGKGTELLFLDRMLPIAIIDSKGIKVSGISIDFAEPQISQAEVVENRGKDGGIVFRPAPWVKWRIGKQQSFEAYGSNWTNTPQWGIVFNKGDYRTAYGIADIGINTQEVKDLGNGTLLAPKWADERLKPGMIIAMRSYDRPYCGIFVDNSVDTEISQVRVHYADGMGLLAQNSHNITLDGFDVARRGNLKGEPSTSLDPRYFTAQADATHFSSCSGRIKVSNGLFEHMMDDAINVHGVYLRLTKRIDDYTVEGRYMHSQAWGFEWGRKGDPVQFIYSKTFDNLKGYNKIKSIEPLDQSEVKGTKGFRIRFAKKLPQDLKPETSIALENMRKLAEVEFSHNVIRNNRARGALFNTPKRVLVEHNLFDHVSGAGIVSSTDCNQWYESGQTQDMIIRHNTFNDVLTAIYQFTEAVISLHPVIPELEKQKIPFYGNKRGGITIEHNVFSTFDTPLLYAKSVKGLVWSESNQIKPTQSYPKFHWNQERFKLVGCKDMHIH